MSTNGKVRFFLTNFGASLLATSLWALIGYSWLTQNAASIIAEGVELTDVQQTSDGLSEVRQATADATALLDQDHGSEAVSLTLNIRKQFAELRMALRKLTIQEYYSVEELTKLAKEVGFPSDRNDFLRAKMNTPKRTVTGAKGLTELIARIDTNLETLDRQLDQLPRIDVTALRRELSKIDRKIGEIKAALDARKAATLATLKAVDAK